VGFGSRTREVLMHYLVRFSCAFGLALLPAFGCGPDGCQAPLGDYCQGSDCPTYEESLADAQEYAQQRCDDPFNDATFGQCGDFRYVWRLVGIGSGTVQYFDASGALVAVRQHSDTPMSCDEDSFERWYGPVLDCEPEAAGNFCD
jgi:hypothetical protein